MIFAVFDVSVIARRR